MGASQLDAIAHPAIVVALGGRGTGKSATCFRIAEDFRYRLTPYVVGFPEHSRGLLPEWIGIAQSLEDVPAGAIAIVDEAYSSHHARDWQKTGNKDVCRQLNLSRQQDKTIVFIAQLGRQLDVDIVASADVLLLKNPGLLQPEFERPQFRSIFLEAKQAFQTAEGDLRRWSYVRSQRAGFSRLVESDLPTFWSPGLSTAHAHIGEMSPSRLPKELTLEQKRQEAKELTQVGWSLARIAKHFGVSKSTAYNWVHDYPNRRRSE